MNDQTVRHRVPPKGCIQYRVYPLVESIPTGVGPAIRDGARRDGHQNEIRLDEHLVPYQGCTLDKQKFVWGVYGHVSQHRMHSAAFAEATARKMECLVVEALYRVGEHAIARSTISQEDARETGFLHIDRMRADFRAELKARMLKVGPTRYAGFDTARNSSKKLSHLLLEYPGLVEDIFVMDKKVRMVVHSVRPSWQSWSKGVVQICTMRRLRGRIEGGQIASLPHVRIVH